MGRSVRFLHDACGAVTIGSLAIGTGVVSVSAFVAFAISTNDPVSTDALHDPVTVEISQEALPLTRSVDLPVGSVVVHSTGSFTSFELPDGGWLDAWSAHDAIPAGSVLTSPGMFTTKEGQTLDAERYASMISEAYSSQVKYAFK